MQEVANPNRQRLYYLQKTVLVQVLVQVLEGWECPIRYSYLVLVLQQVLVQHPKQD